MFICLRVQCYRPHIFVTAVLFCVFGKNIFKILNVSSLFSSKMSNMVMGERKAGCSKSHGHPTYSVETLVGYH